MRVSEGVTVRIEALNAGIAGVLTIIVFVSSKCGYGGCVFKGLMFSLSFVCCMLCMFTRLCAESCIPLSLCVCSSCMGESGSWSEVGEVGSVAGDVCLITRRAGPNIFPGMLIMCASGRRFGCLER